MKKCSKGLILVAVTALLFALAGCGGGTSDEVPSSELPSSEEIGGSENLTGKIVFIASIDEAAHQRAVYVIDTDGNNLLQLTDYSIGAQDPVWSPDGKRIAFTSIKDGGIYTINADGTNLTRIVYKTVYDVYTNTWNIAANRHPSWSPDGSMICYESYGDEDSGTTVANANIYVVNSDGTGIRRLTNDLSYEGKPSWLPQDGSKIAFVYIKNEGDGYSNYHIFVMNTDGNNWVQLTDRNITVNNQDPDWSPNGTKILFTGDGDKNQGVFSIDLKDKSQTFIGVIGGSPKWSPDGTKIITDGWYSEGNISGMRIWITNTDGSNSKMIDTPIDMSVSEPDWISDITESVPSSPSDITASLGDAQVTIGWNTVSGASSYNIYWSTTPGVTKSNNKIASITSPYSHTGLINGTTYYYVITAENSLGESRISTEVSATIPTTVGSGTALRILPGYTLSACIDTYTGESHVGPQTLMAAGGSPFAGYTWSTPSFPPMGTTIAPLTGVFSSNGGALITGQQPFTVEVYDGTSTATGSVTLNVVTASSAPSGGIPMPGCPLTVLQQYPANSFALDNAVVNKPYGASLFAMGGTPPYSWSEDTSYSEREDFDLSGLTIDQSRGIVRGTLLNSSAGKTLKFKLIVKDSAGETAIYSPVYTITVQ